MLKNDGRIIDRLILGLLILGVITLVAERIWTTFILPASLTAQAPAETDIDSGKSSQSLLKRAREIQRLNRPDLAEDVLTQASDIEPDSPEILFELGQNQDRLGKYAKARENYDRLRSIEPHNPRSYAALGRTHVAEGQMDQALLWIKQAQSLKRANLEHAGWMLFLCSSMENFQAADYWSEWLNHRITNQPFPIAMKAQYHYLTGNFESAIQYANLALKLRFPDRLGSNAIFMRIKRDEALADGAPDHGIEVFATQYPGLIGTAPQVTANNAQQAVDLAQLLALAGRNRESRQLARAVLEFLEEPWAVSGSNRSWLVSARAEALAVLGDTDAALNELRRIVDGGWRYNWRWETELNYNFMAIRETEGFRQVIAALMTDTENQRQRFETLSTQPTRPWEAELDSG